MISNIVASILFTFYFIDMGRFHLKWKLPSKPFGCHICLSVWVALALYWSPDWISHMLIVMFAAPVITILFRNLINNLTNHGTHRIR